MSQMCKSNLSIIIIAAASLGIGYFAGSYFSNCKTKNADTASTKVTNNNFSSKSEEELKNDLSLVMLPQDEFSKLLNAIEQTGLGLLNAQAQSKNVTITPEIEKNLTDTIKEKYTRKYFSDINLTSMKELNKEELTEILNFYASNAGTKIRDLTPKIIQSTMQVVQKDLSEWMPSTIEQIIKDPTKKPSNIEVKKEEPAQVNN